jgi:4-amino-4-deoxy-L-arabinose transferase-like glycosyltransferase
LTPHQGLLLHAWAIRQFGTPAGLAGLTLYAFCPSILAHAGLATTDLGASLTIFLAGYVLHRHLSQPSFPRLLAAGFTLGLALLSKPTGFFLLPLWFLVFLLVNPAPWPLRLKRMIASRNDLGGLELRGLGAYAAMTAIALFTVWAGYGFELHSIHDPATLLKIALSPDPFLWLRRGILQVMAWLPLPPPTYYYGLGASILNRAADHDQLYFFGRLSDTGWWYYYPILFAMKVPATLLIFMASFLLLWKKLPSSGIVSGRIMLIAGGGLLIIFMTFNTRNIGLRHLLPIFPFLHLSLSRLFVPDLKPPWLRRAMLILLALYVLNGVFSWPSYLVHFNSLAGGTERGLRYSVVGEDWGQDLPALARYCREHDIDIIRYLPYSSADPQAYGVPYVRLDCKELAPGWYALQVVDLRRPRGGIPLECINFFRNRRPVAILNHTIYVFRLD